jgi:UPF0716 family protein affecting phage T7 exclusion
MLLVIAALLLIAPELVSSLVGFLLLAIVAAVQKLPGRTYGVAPPVTK